MERGTVIFSIEHDWLLVNDCEKCVIPSSFLVDVNIMIGEILGLKICWIVSFLSLDKEIK